MHYNLQVLRGDEILLSERLVLTGVEDIWPRIARLAEGVSETGCHIRVTKEAGRIAVLIGVTAARCLFRPPAGHPPA